MFLISSSLKYLLSMTFMKTLLKLSVMFSQQIVRKGKLAISDYIRLAVHTYFATRLSKYLYSTVQYDNIT